MANAIKKRLEATVAADGSGEIRVYDVIGDDWFGITAKQVSDALAEFKAQGVKSLAIRINSPGGSAFDGIAIHNLIRQWPGEKTVYVDGLAASAASVVALAGDRVVMGDAAMLMIHNPATWMYGEAEEFRHEAGVLDALRESVVALYAARTGQSAEDLRAWMDAETWMDAELAIDRGFAHERAGSAEVEPQPENTAAAAIFARFKHAPQSAMRFVNLAALSRVSPRDAAPEEKQMPEQTHQTPTVPAPAQTVPAPAPAQTAPAPEQNAEIASLKASVDELRDMLSRTVTTFGKHLETAATTAAAPVVAKFKDAKKIATPKNAVLGAIAKANLRARRLGIDPLEAARNMGQVDIADAMQNERDRRMAYSEGSASTGGVLVPEETGAEVIELLKARSVVLSAGARMFTMNSDTLRIPRQKSGGSGSYIGENSAPAASSATFEQIVLNAKKIAAMSVVSNEMLEDASVDMQALIQDDLISACALRMDLAAMTGNGTDYEPRGFTSWIDSAHQTQQTGATYANWIADLNKLKSALESDDVPLENCCFFMSPRTKNGLWGLQDPVGKFVFREQMNAGMLDGHPYRVTSQISTTGAASRLFFVRMPDFIVGMRKEFAIDLGDTYEDGGVTKSAFANDQSVVRLIGRHDFALRHPESGAIIHTVTLS